MSSIVRLAWVRHNGLFALIYSGWIATHAAPAVSQTVQHSGLSPSQIGLIINDYDPYSVAIGEYYRVRRQIPITNVVHVGLATTPSMSRTDFATLKTSIDFALPATVQALAIAWTNPSRVECNSMTSAMARGFMAAPCDGTGSLPTCAFATASPYYNSTSTQPFTDFQMRPAMMLAAWNIADGEAMIERGIAADNSQPYGSAYIMATNDSTRSLRATSFPTANLSSTLNSHVNVQIVHAQSIVGTTDALFYFQGLSSVPNITTNTFPAGAIADHLTSFGGMLTDSTQMSVLDFVAGGATGTFGTVSEPCAYAQKFPNPSIVISHYTQGETLIEAYWKSVSQTFQGEFVGEPLSNPWRQTLP